MSLEGEEYKGGGAVEFQNVTFAYDGASEPSLKNISFTLKHVWR